MESLKVQAPINQDLIPNLFQFQPPRPAKLESPGGCPLGCSSPLGA